MSPWSDVGHPVERRHPGPLGPELHQVPEIDQEGVPVLLQEWDVTPGVLHLGLETVVVISPEEGEAVIVRVLPVQEAA